MRGLHPILERIDLGSCSVQFKRALAFAHNVSSVAPERCEANERGPRDDETTTLPCHTSPAGAASDTGSVMK